MPDALLVRTRSIAPGLAVAGLAAAASFALATLVHGVSALLIAIVLGIAFRNLVRLPARIEASLAPGLAVASRRVLRIGVVLLGLQLVLGDILKLGLGMILVVIAIVVLGILSMLALGRLLGISPSQRLLIACGFSICGAAAVAAVDGVIETEDDEEVVVAVALVVLFGTLMIPLVPLAGAALGLGEIQTGLWAGGSIHEVAQVVAAGTAIGGAGLAVAVVVKLARVLMLAPVLATISLSRRRAMRRGESTAGATGKLPPIVPLFVVGFVVMVLIRSTGIVPPSVVAVAGGLQTALLAAAMFALGAGVRISMFRRVGFKPFVLAAVGTAVVAAVALGGVMLVA